MSFEVTTSFVEQYKSNVLTLVQQRGSKLRNAVMVDSDVVGKKKFVGQIGTTNATVRSSRHADSPLVNSPHARRAYTLTDYEWGDLIDDADRVRMLIDPTDAYSQNAAWAMGRAMDDEIITAATGNALTGSAATTSTSHSSDGGTQIANTYVESGSATAAGLTVGKLRKARQVLTANEVAPDEKLYIAVRAQQIQDLLTDEEVTSGDYNTIRALVNGELDTYMGFTFVHTERLANVTSTDVTTCFAWAESALVLGVGADVRAQIAPRADKAFSTYIYLSMSIGATRLEGKKVVDIQCDESP